MHAVPGSFGRTLTAVEATSAAERRKRRWPRGAIFVRLLRSAFTRLQALRLLELDEHVARFTRSTVDVLDVEVVRRARLQDRVIRRRAAHRVGECWRRRCDRRGRQASE